MKKAACSLAILAVVLSAQVAYAAPQCANPNYFSTLGSSKFTYSALGPEWDSGDRRGPYDGSDATPWIYLLQKYAIETPNDNPRYSECDYKSAIEAFENLEKDGLDEAERKTWLLNQDRILQVCEKGGAGALSYPDKISPRLAMEKDYQSAAFVYYTEPGHPEVIEAFRKIGFTKGHPRQADALRSYVRMIFADKGIDAAWDESEKIRTDIATKDIWPRIEDMRFEMMTIQRMSDGSGDSLAAQQKILPWLLEILKEKQSSGEYEKLRQMDATANLRWYLPISYKDEDRRPVLDWWLTDKELNSEMLAVARDEMKKEDLFALMQMEQTIRYESLTSLYDLQNPVRDQQKHLSHYAFDKYKNCRGPEWLPYALRFAVKGQDNLDEIIQASHAVLNDEMLKKTQKSFRLSLWSDLIKAELLAGHDDAAIDLLNRDDLELNRNKYDDKGARQEALNNVLEWFIHQGKYEAGRKALLQKAIELEGWQYRKYKAYRIILAASVDDLKKEISSLNEDTAENEIVSPLLNLMPGSVLMEISTAKDAEGRWRNRPEGVWNTYLASTAATRAWVLGDKKALREAVLTLNKLDETGDKSFLKAIEGDALDQTLFFLTHPRLRPYNPSFSFEFAWSSPEIDNYNPNDNNWWCRFNPEAERADLYREWSLMPYSEGVGHIKVDEARYAEARKKAIDAHPLWKLVDNKELEALAKIPSGPELLSRRAIHDAGGKFAVVKKLLGDERIPQVLAASVRATRYGCRNDGPHKDYSQKAFEILHRYYKDTSWAQATPYWFK